MRQQKGVGEGDLVTKFGEEKSRKGGACSQLKHSAPRLHLALIEPEVPFQQMSQGVLHLIKITRLGQGHKAKCKDRSLRQVAQESQPVQEPCYNIKEETLGQTSTALEEGSGTRLPSPFLLKG